MLSLRATLNGGAEAEINISHVGLGATVMPGFHTTQGTSGGVVVCSAKFDRTFLFGRYFFRGPQDSWYLGGYSYEENLTSASNCGDSALSGASLMLGYQWMWESGFNIDLGLRPGLLALGISF